MIRKSVERLSKSSCSSKKSKRVLALWALDFRKPSLKEAARNAGSASRTGERRLVSGHDISQSNPARISQGKRDDGGRAVAAARPCAEAEPEPHSRSRHEHTRRLYERGADTRAAG